MRWNWTPPEAESQSRQPPEAQDNLRQSKAYIGYPAGMTMKPSVTMEMKYEKSYNNKNKHFTFIIHHSLVIFIQLNLSALKYKSLFHWSYR